MYGLHVDGAGLNYKPTRVATHNRIMCDLERKCSGHPHSRLLGGTRTKYAEDFPPQLAKVVAMLMASDDYDLDGNHVYVVDVDDMGVTPIVPETVEGAEVMDGEVFAGRGLVERMD